MLRDEVARGVRGAGGLAGLADDQAEAIATVITQQAFSDAAGRHALAVSERGGVVFFDLFKAVTATAGILAAVGPLASGLAIPAVLAAIGALGGLQGLRQPLPRSCAQVVAVLLDGADRTLTQIELRRRFAEIYEGPAAELETDLKSALDRLTSLRCIEVEHGEVRLIERIVIRW